MSAFVRKQLHNVKAFDIFGVSWSSLFEVYLSDHFEMDLTQNWRNMGRYACHLYFMPCKHSCRLFIPSKFFGLLGLQALVYNELDSLDISYIS